MWEDFKARNELFTDIEKSKVFDFVKNALNSKPDGADARLLSR
jgi:hypothetical protein